MLGFSKVFQARLVDISCWAFDGDFVSTFPEIASDVVLYGPRPVQIALRRVDNDDDAVSDPGKEHSKTPGKI